VSLFESRIQNLSPEKQRLFELLQHAEQRERESLRRIPRTGKVALSFAQQRLWVLNQLNPQDVAYNMSVGIHLTGTVNLEALRWTVNEVVRRHEALRTRFLAVDGEPVQVIEEKLEIDCYEGVCCG
jgi:hypothetical protein